MHVGKLSRNSPLRLKKAAEVAFPEGGISENSLRTLIHRGLLRAEMIAGRYFTTIEYIEEMRLKCRVEQKDRDFNSGRAATMRKEILSKEESTLSETGDGMSPQDALRVKLKRLKKNSQNTSLKNDEHEMT
ncbi:excisionase [Roseibium album]|uniref:excisionase n=1 Tax=Roseibium album TaxID=311410 RepID=UPI003BB1F39C